MEIVVRVASFDIGKKNFAFCTEDVNLTELMSLKLPNVKSRYLVDGTPTEEMRRCIDTVYKNGKIRKYRNVDLTRNGKWNNQDEELFLEMYNFLDRYIDEWRTVNYIVIEEQMSFGKIFNKLAMKLAQHCYSYFVFRLWNDGYTPHIIEFPAKYKTQVLGASKKVGKGKKRFVPMTKPERKKWSVIEATHIFKLRGDEKRLDELKSASKKDDLADVVTQLQAFKIRLIST